MKVRVYLQLVENTRAKDRVYHQLVENTRAKARVYLLWGEGGGRVNLGVRVPPPCRNPLLHI